jgi:transcriptional regulator with GAF, ATPase, and Fis domain
MLRPGELTEVMESLATQAAEALGLPAAVVVLLDAERQPQPVAATDAIGTGLVTAELELGEGPTLAALGSGAVVFADDLPRDERWPRCAGQARSAGATGVLAVPLRAAERPAGVVTVVATEPHAWQLTEVAAVEVLAELASGYVAHECTLDSIQRTVDQLQQALESRVDIEQAKGVLVGRPRGRAPRSPTAGARPAPGDVTGRLAGGVARRPGAGSLTAGPALVRSAPPDHPTVRRHTSSQGVATSPSSAVMAEESIT